MTVGASFEALAAAAFEQLLYQPHQRRLLWRVKHVVSHLHVGELAIPQVSLTGLPEDARRLLERIGVPLPEPTGTAWVAGRLDAEKAAMRP